MFTFMLTKTDFMGYCSCKLKFFFMIKHGSHQFL